MVFQVFEIALREGCGITLAEALETPEFRELHAAEVAIPEQYPADSGLGSTHRIQPMDLCVYYHEPSDDFRGNEYEFDPTTRALIRFLGRRIISAADAQLPLEILEMSEDGEALSPDQKVGCAQRLMEIIDERSSKPAYEIVDMVRQTIDGVLPLRYGPIDLWGNPNCVGRAQLFLALARRLGVKTFALTPIERFDEYLQRIHWVFCRTSLETAAEFGIEFHPQTLADIRAVEAIEKKNGQLVDYLHFGQVWEIAERRWFLTDPLLSQCTEFPVDETLAHKFTTLDELELVCPGLTLCYETASVYGFVDKKAETYRSYSGLAIHYAQMLTDECTVPKLIAPLAASRVLDDFDDIVAAWKRAVPDLKNILDDHSPENNAKRRMYMAGLVIYTTAVAPREGLILDQARADEFFQRFLLTDDPDPALVAEARSRLPEAMLKLGIRSFEVPGIKIIDEQPLYRYSQLSNAEFSMGVAVLAHLGVILGIADETEALLAKHTSCQYRALYFGTTALRHGDRQMTKPEMCAIHSLVKAPFRLRTADRALKALVERGPLPVQLSSAEEHACV